MKHRANIVGAGPNGLSAAIVLAQAGMEVQVFEAESQAGGAARTLELTLPGYWHDFGSAVHPMAAGSPFFSSLPLEEYGLQWIHSPVPLAHPLDDGTAVLLPRNLGDVEQFLGGDGRAWKQLTEPFATEWEEFAEEILSPMPRVPTRPMLMARFGLDALRSAQATAARFGEARTRALFAGLAAHSFLALEEPLSAAVAIVLGAAAHAVGWPIPRGGAQSITDALCGLLSRSGGRVTTSYRVDRLSSLEQADLTLCDVSPPQLAQLAEDRLTKRYLDELAGYRRAPGVFKVDYALSEPIPWTATDCTRAATVHLGGTFEEIAASERSMSLGHTADQPFVLLAQPSLFDTTRAPAGRHTAWAYCHVPNGSTVEMLESLERQIERFAPGFRECVLQRKVFSPHLLERLDANLVGGDISGGKMNLYQTFLRPTWRQYATSSPDIYICSSSTPPGGGVHGMCGYHAARRALRRIR
jgi:phytoene dehydrogenase-like protein